MKNELKEKLTKEIQQAEWELLEPHHARSAVYYLKKPNDLVQISILIVENKSHLIQGYLTAQELHFPTENQINIWKNTNTNLNFLIISPFVLVQD